MIKRKIFEKLKQHISSDQMTILIGPRQVGKTYLMTKLRDELQKEGKKTIWLSLDNEIDKNKFVSQETLINFIELHTGKDKCVIFVDEIQRKENAGLFLKGIFDMKLPYKFIVSGSGSLELKAKISESMAGRKRLFAINPISFEEFVDFKTDYQFKGRLAKYFQIETEKMTKFISEYLVFGGYPRVILAETADLKQAEMQEIFRSYIDRDIRDLLHLEKTDAFNNLMKIIASQIGRLVNISELASTLQIDVKTVKHYLYYLEQTFIIQKVTPFFRNIRSEITKAPVYYFIDLGLRNWLLGLFGLPEIPIPLSGHLFENLVFNILYRQIDLTPTNVHFWRTKDQAEVDFILEKGLEITPIEVKFTKLEKPEISKSFHSFLNRYKPNKGYVINMGNKNNSIKIANTTIKLFPFYNLFFKYT